MTENVGRRLRKWAIISILEPHTNYYDQTGLRSCK
jgi:hypothetical protein